MFTKNLQISWYLWSPLLVFMEPFLAGMAEESSGIQLTNLECEQSLKGRKGSLRPVWPLGLSICYTLLVGTVSKYRGLMLNLIRSDFTAFYRKLFSV